MRIPAQASLGTFRRRPLAALGFLIVFVVAADKAANYVIAGDMTGLALVAMASVGCVLVVAMLNNWRNGLYFFLTWLLFEDFARKYLGNNMAIYFAKDVLAAVVYLSFFLAYRRKEVTSFRPPFLMPLLLFVWFGLMQVFNPAYKFDVRRYGDEALFLLRPLIFCGIRLAQFRGRITPLLFCQHDSRVDHCFSGDSAGHHRSYFLESRNGCRGYSRLEYSL
jgi:hypothetical protein